MEARFVLTIVLSIALSVCQADAQQQTYKINSDNFVVYAPDPGLARRASTLAEQYRKDLALDWLGYEIDQWREKCPIYITVGPHAGGETSFAFIQNASGKSEPVGWDMKIYGPMDRLLDAVLPHEVTHTIFATHFGRPLPRWADEGACTTVEHASERQKNHRMLLSFLGGSPSRGIPFNKMFMMKQYPRDMLALYAQGYSVARFLIGQKGRQHFVQYIERGLSMENSNFDTRSWDMATKEFYGFEDLSDLQVNWISWVRAGSPEQTQAATLASTNANNQNLIDPQGTYAVAPDQNAGMNVAESPGSKVASNFKKAGQNRLNTWYARQSRAKQALPPNNDLPSAPEPELGFRPGSLKRFERSAQQSANSESSAKPIADTIWR